MRGISPFEAMRQAPLHVGGLKSMALSMLVILLTGLCAFPSLAQVSPAPIRLDAKYTITMTGVSIGQLTWTSVLTDTDYETSAKGKAAGLLSVLIDGQASLRAQGTVLDGRPAASQFQSSIQDEDGDSVISMTLDGGSVADLTIKGSLPKNRVPLRETDRHNVVDPLTAMLFDSNGSGNLMPSETCNRTLAIFDGARRYNLLLTFKRRDKIAIEHSYAGPVLVCGLTLVPISGHKADSAIVKYVAKKDDLELWIAPIAGTSIAAPIRFRSPTLLGTLEIRADKFEAIESSAPGAAR
jgi:hypothetical protein